MDRLSEWLNGPGFVANKPGTELTYAIVKAVPAHVYLVDLPLRNRQWTHGAVDRISSTHVCREAFACGAPDE